ncbi:MAG TPA: hypothetical protein VM142_00520 [Acidimicrobiales bacterium]|nr:hypothetical protein [Acidimicrobiales bacterium]
MTRRLVSGRVHQLGVVRLEDVVAGQIDDSAGAEGGAVSLAVAGDAPLVVAFEVEQRAGSQERCTLAHVFGFVDIVALLVHQHPERQQPGALAADGISRDIPVVTGHVHHSRERTQGRPGPATERLVGDHEELGIAPELGE